MCDNKLGYKFMHKVPYTQAFYEALESILRRFLYKHD